MSRGRPCTQRPDDGSGGVITGVVYCQVVDCGVVNADVADSDTVISDLVPRAIRTELERLGERWQTLPLAQALAHAPALREVAQDCADHLPPPDRAPTEPLVRDLGPACAYDQLSTLVYDLCGHRASDAAGPWAASLAEQIAALRSALR